MEKEMPADHDAAKCCLAVREIQAKSILCASRMYPAGIRTYAMIAPLLPGAENLVAMLAGTVDYIRVDRMNYHYADFIYKKCGLEHKLSKEYFSRAGHKILADCELAGIECSIVG